MRIDGQAEVASAALRTPLALSGGDMSLFLDVDGTRHEIPLDPSFDATDVRDAINDTVAPVRARLEETARGQHLVVRREELLLPGYLTVFAHPALGFAQAAEAVSQPIDSTLGQVIRAFFGAGGRRAYVIRLGDPLPYLHDRESRLLHLVRLLHGKPTAAQRAAVRVGELPPAPVLPSPRQPAETWYGTAHVFGLEDATLLSLPDLPELVCPTATGAAARAAGK